MALGHSGSQLNIHGFLFFSKLQDAWVRFPIYTLIGPSAMMTVHVWTQPLGGFCWSTRCDLLGEKKTVPPPCWQPIGGCLEQKAWRVGRAGLSLFALGKRWPPCQTAVYGSLACDGHWAADHPDRGLFPICLSLCSLSTSAAWGSPDAWRESGNRSVCPLDYSPWLWITDRTRRVKKLA